MLDIDRTLIKIVSNLWFEWSDDAHILFRSLSPYLWGLFRRNLYRFMKMQSENTDVYHHRLAELLTHEKFLQLFQKVEKDYKSYMNPEQTFVSRYYPELSDRMIAYFSMEYGIDILRIYSGGLGILSGDHLRGASDIGLKMVGVGLFYQQGYYEQVVGTDGTMRVFYESVVPPHKPVREFLPLDTVKDARSDKDLILEIPIADRIVKARVWRAKIGRNDLLLLDTDLHENPVHDRHITKRLYASQKHYEEERRRRLEQEIILGVGGAQALERAGYKPAVYHMNEGHVTFAALEVIRLMMQEHGFPFEDAMKRTASIVGFTSHTPVPEGNETFDERLVREHLTAYLDRFLAPHEREVIFNCARNREDRFDMTKLALLLSGIRNGVSKLHGEVCRGMWKWVFGYELRDEEVPITHVTNGVHVPYWQKPKLRHLIDSVGGLQSVPNIPDEKIWALHLEFKSKLIQKVRERRAYQLLRERAESQTIYERTSSFLTTDSFMIGFARRFAEYKRATMVLEDEEGLFNFLEASYKKYRKPIAFLFAGKPHPNNYPGYVRIRNIFDVAKRLEERCRERNFQADIVFIEGYDIDLARYLEAGVDIWLNNPIRPHEASGTSGMKAGMNGVLNVSISDGWVPEGIVQGVNGWMFGRGDSGSAADDRAEFYKLLEKEILPVYFERDAGLYSIRWVAMMKESIRSITTQFNTDRMLIEYIEKMYLPGVKTEASRALIRAAI